MLVFPALAMVSNHPYTPSEILVIRRHGTAFSTRTKVLTRVKAERRSLSD